MWPVFTVNDIPEHLPHPSSSIALFSPSFHLCAPALPHTEFKMLFLKSAGPSLNASVNSKLQGWRLPHNTAWVCDPVIKVTQVIQERNQISQTQLLDSIYSFQNRIYTNASVHMRVHMCICTGFNAILFHHTITRQ